MKDLVDHDPSWEGAVFPADEFSERREDTEVAIFREVVGAPRFELGTSCSRSKRATRLRYAPTKEGIGG